jgi:hypothetical protein
MTDPTLAERVARCVKPLEWEPWALGLSGAASIFGTYHTWAGHWRGPKMQAGQFAANPEAAAQADYQSRILAALDLDALAREVEAMVGAEREAIAAWLEAHDYYTAGAERGFSPARFPGMDQHHKAIAAAIRAREGGKP